MTSPTGATAGSSARRRRWSLRYVLMGVLVLVVLGAAGVWWFLRDDAPPGATLIDRSSTTVAGSTTAPLSADGVWKVQPGDGVFAGYRVQEQYAAETVKKTAVGRTPAVSGTITVQGRHVVKAEIQADMSRLASNSDRRDNRIRTSGLETDKYPSASFTLGDTLDLGNDPRVGETVTVKASGNLTLHGVTKPVTLDLQARWNGSSIDIAGSTPIAMADFGITPPSVGGFVTVDDNGVMELQLTFVPG